jgi:virginiamycin B lyase
MIRSLMRAAAFAVAVAGTALAAEVRTYPVPEGAGPHDVAPAPDGKVWYSAQGAGALGILDPATGEVRHVPLGEGSAPHGVIQGPDGAAWLTDGGLNAIVRVDPKTEEVKSWPLPEEVGYANLNTATFDKSGTLWFTGQAGVYGRLDPQRGEMRVWKDPDGPGPYGITATPDGRVFFASLAGSHIAEIDTATGEKRRIDPQTQGQGARRVWSDSRGNIWVSEWNSGQLSRYLPGSGEWRAWKLPGERPRAYAVYVDERDIVWLSDFGANATLSFDSSTETFTSWPGSGQNANVRQISGRQGEVFLPESGLDRITIIRTSGEAAGE